MLMLQRTAVYIRFLLLTVNISRYKLKSHDGEIPLEIWITLYVFVVDTYDSKKLVFMYGLQITYNIKILMQRLSLHLIGKKDVGFNESCIRM